MNNFQLKAKDYKCFGEIPQGFDEFRRINVIIGKNNSGKSSLVDLVEFLIKRGRIEERSRRQQRPDFLMTKTFTEEEITASFPSGRSGGGIDGDHRQYGLQWVGKPITIKLNQERANDQYYSAEPEFARNEHTNNYLSRLVREASTPFSGKSFRRLRAERDIIPEQGVNTDVQENGAGATSVMERCINFAEIDGGSLVDGAFLKALNEIYSPENIFTRVRVQRLGDNKWEIFLDEEGKPSVKLSNSGSGLKTVILILIYTILIPLLERKSLGSYCFAFEEIENNLHPGLQRKLLSYLSNLVKENEGLYIFLTTHSNVIIDVFSREDNAQILHLQKQGTDSVVNKITTHFENHLVLDDLGVRASDLLQSNGIVWLEGPSDRVYFNRWIEILSAGDLKEGLHYQCAFYGGRLLSHLSADIEGGNHLNLVEILRINRNVVIMMDSDKESEEDSINATKTRIKSEVELGRGLVWITEGREIENYLPVDVLKNHFQNLSLPNFGKYEKMTDYITRAISPEEARNYERDKVGFAEKTSMLFDERTIRDSESLNSQLLKVIELIKIWNNTP